MFLSFDFQLGDVITQDLGEQWLTVNVGLIPVAQDEIQRWAVVTTTVGFCIP